MSRLLRWEGEVESPAIVSFVLGGAASPLALKVVDLLSSRGRHATDRKRQELTDLAKERARADREREHRIAMSLWAFELELILRQHGLPYPDRPPTPDSLKDHPKDTS